jgi:hypothetical protein
MTDKAVELTLKNVSVDPSEIRVVIPPNFQPYGIEANQSSRRGCTCFNVTRRLAYGVVSIAAVFGAMYGALKLWEYNGGDVPDMPRIPNPFDDDSINPINETMFNETGY